MTSAEAKINPIRLAAGDMEELTGEYSDGNYGIHIKDNNLFWRYTDGTDYILIPLEKDLFGFDDTDDIRIKIARDNSGVISGFHFVDPRRGESPLMPRTGDWTE
jgi:hypothetical protein